MKPKYKRILLKLSGESLAGPDKHGINFDTVLKICEPIRKCNEKGVQIGIVVGGGNFWRGRTSGDMNRVKADHIGMLATVMNAIALCDGLDRLGVPAVVMTAAEMKKFAETFYQDKAIDCLQSGKVVIFGGGTGNPYFSTDTGAALRAIEIGADILMKATNVDGVYDKDPNKYADAVKYDRVTPQEVLEKGIKVMDSTAFALCKDNNMPILVFNLEQKNSIIDAIHQKEIGTLVSD